MNNDNLIHRLLIKLTTEQYEYLLQYIEKFLEQDLEDSSVKRVQIAKSTVQKEYDYVVVIDIIDNTFDDNKHQEPSEIKRALAMAGLKVIVDKPVYAYEVHFYPVAQYTIRQQKENNIIVRMIDYLEGANATNTDLYKTIKNEFDFRLDPSMILNT